MSKKPATKPLDFLSFMIKNLIFFCPFEGKQERRAIRLQQRQKPRCFLAIGHNGQLFPKMSDCSPPILPQFEGLFAMPAAEVVTPL